MEPSLDNLMEQWNNSIPRNQDQVFNIKDLVSQLLNVFPLLVKDSLRYSPIILDDQANWSQLDSNKYYEFISLNGDDAPDAGKLGDSQGIVFILKTSSSYKFLIAFTKYGIATQYRDNEWNYISYSEAYIDDSNAVHKTEDEEIAGKKTFDVAPIDKTTGNPYITKDPMDESLGSLTSFKPTGSNLIDKLNNEFNDRGVNVKWFGAKGDGVTDDTLSIQSAIDTGSSIFLPPGKYNVTELKGFASGQIIQGISKVESWGESNAQNITLLNGIGSADNYVIKNNVWGNGVSPTAIAIKNLSIAGNKKTNGILVGNSSTIEGVKVQNCINGLSNLKVSNVMNCQINGCTNGVMNATDSKITNNFIYLNEVGINFDSSNDNSIINNKIEWNGIGISITKAVFNLISNNIIDRSTTYGIYTMNTTNTTITGNQFERNLTNHLYLGGAAFNISANSLFRKNSEDDQSGTVVPDVAIFTKSVTNVMITNNYVDGKMFNTTGTDYSSELNVFANTVNGINPDNITVSIPETTVVHGQDTKIIIPLPSYFDGALNNPYNVEILSQKISFTTQGGNFYSNGGIIKNIYVSTSGIELTILNDLNDDLKINGTIQVRCPYSNLY